MNYWMIAITAFLGIQYLLSVQQEVAVIPYSEFEQHLKEGRVEELAITERRIEGMLKEPLSGGQRRFVSNASSRSWPSICSSIRCATPARWRARWCATCCLGHPGGAVLRHLAVPAAAHRQRPGGGGMMQIGKSKARVYVETDMKVSFADVAGVDGRRTN